MREFEYNNVIYKSNYSLLLDNILISIFDGDCNINLMMDFDEFYDITYRNNNYRRCFTNNFGLYR